MALDFTTSFIKLNNQYTIVGSAEDVEATAVPKKGELYFLPVDGGQRVCKIGDGETPFGELPQIGVETATASTFGTAMASSTSPVMDGTASVGTETTKFARGDHKHPTDTSRAPTNHASSASTYGLGTTSNYGHVKISNGDVATVSSANGLVAGMDHSHSNYELLGHSHDVNIAASSDTSELTLSHNSTYKLTAGGQSFVFKMPTGTHTITANATDGIFNLTGTSGSNAVTYAVAPYTSRQSTAGKFDTSTTNPSGTTRLNWDGYLYATKLYSNGTEVATLSTSQALTNKTYNGYTLAAACAKAVTDSSSANAIGTGTSLVTERDVYYGLPKINNSHSYTSSTSIYAPTAGGPSGCICVGAGTTSAPTWVHTLPIANGGTGASTADAALKNLGAAAASYTPKMSDDRSDFPAGSNYGVIFSSNPVTKNTANNDNYLLHISSTGKLYAGYQTNQMTTPIWNEVSLDGHEHSASDLTSGTLSIARGGTGVTSISALRNVLGLQRVTSLSKTKKPANAAVGSTTSVSFSAPGLIVGYSHDAAPMTGYNGTTFATSISGNALTQTMTIKFSTAIVAGSVTATLFYIPVG